MKAVPLVLLLGTASYALAVLLVALLLAYPVFTLTTLAAGACVAYYAWKFRNEL